MPRRPDRKGHVSDERARVLPANWIPRVESSQIGCPVCGRPLYQIGIEPSGGPLFVCWDHQKQGVLDHIDRYSGLSHPPPHHFDYFTISTLGELIKYGDGSRLPGGNMDPEERLWVLDLTCAAFLSQPEDTDYVVVQSGTDWCHSIQVLFHGGLVGVEVNPRHWDPCTVCLNEPLPPMAVGALRRLGFSRGARDEFHDRWTAATGDRVGMVRRAPFSRRLQRAAAFRCWRALPTRRRRPSIPCSSVTPRLAFGERGTSLIGM